jgi:ribonuclease HI
MFITTPADSTAMDHVIQHEAQPDIALPTNANKGPHLSNFLYNILLHNGNIFTDGSSDKGKATYAVVVQPPAFNCDLQQIDTESFIHFAGQVEGSADDTHSYRAELAGILSAIEFTNNACTQKGLTTGRCTIYCDNKGALLASFGHKRPTPRWSSYDLVRRIRHALLVSPITWHYQHIKGHQDTAKHFSQLSNNAQGNVLADHFATLAHTATAPTLQCKSTSSWTLAINEEAIGGDIHKRLQTAIFKPLMTQRWSKIFGLPATYMTLCDWPTFYRNFELTPASDRHWSTKYNTRLLPVGKNLKRRRHSQTEACPCCGEDEDHNHIISCTHDAMAHTFAELYSDIKTYLNQSTDPAVAHDICCLLQIYRDPNHLSTYAEELGMQIHQQLQLGQGAFFAGLWTKHWLQQQEQYHQRVKIKRHAQRWLISLIQMIQQIPKTLWKVRNQVLHNTRDPLTLQRQHNELNATIDNIFQRKPHQRLMSHCDNLYFSKYTQTQIKHMKLHRKTNWITGANLILTKYERSTTNQSARFTSYFIWDNG